MLARRLAAGVAALALVAFGALTASSAAPLGGLTSQAATTACEVDGIGLAYTNAYDASSNTYQTTAVTMSGVATPCAGKQYQLTLSDGTASLSESTGTVSAGSQTVTLTAPVSAQAVTHASLVITG